MSTNDVARCDAIVLGAGPAGSATALALRRKGWSVALFERSEHFETKAGDSLHGAAQAALDELGLWQAFRSMPWRRTYLVRSVWGQGGVVREKPSLAHRYGPDFHVDRAELDEWLLARACDAGVQLYRPGLIEGVARTDTRSSANWRVRARCNGLPVTLEADFLVDASGRSAWLSRELGAKRSTLDRLIGVARWFDASDAEPAILVEATEQGWWYSAPAPHGQLIVVWMTDATLPQARAARAEIWERCVSLSRLTAARLRSVGACSLARVLPASPSITTWTGTPPWLPVGDAALTFDPVSGAGLCFALRSALEVALVLEAARRGNSGALEAYRIGAQAVFRDHLQARAHTYEQERRFAHTPFWQAPRGTELWL